MKKNVFLSILILFFGLAMFSTTSCSKYDEQIDELEQRLAELEADFDAIQQSVDAGATITGVESITNGIKITLSNGNSYEITNGTNGANGADGAAGAAGTKYEIDPTDGTWIKDGVDTNLPSQGAAGANGADADMVYYYPGAEGFWVKVTVDAETKEQTEETTTMEWLPEGTITAVLNADGTVTLYNVEGAGEEGVVIGGAKYLTSIAYVPSDYNGEYGDIAYFPVIGKYISVDSLEKVYPDVYFPIGEGNEGGGEIIVPVDLLQKRPVENESIIWELLFGGMNNGPGYFETLVDGYAMLQYKTNTSNISLDKFDLSGVVTKSVRVRSEMDQAGDTLNCAEIVSLMDGILTVRASAADFLLRPLDNMRDAMHPNQGYMPYLGHYEGMGYMFDDPHAIGYELPHGELDNFSTIVNNKEAGATQAEVSSEYTAMARLVVPEQLISVALDVDSLQNPTAWLSNKLIFSDIDLVWSAGNEIFSNHGDMSNEVRAIIFPFSDYYANPDMIDELMKDHDEQIIDFFEFFPVNLQVEYKEKAYNLNDHLEAYAMSYMTNTSFVAPESEYNLADLGFGDLSFEYSSQYFWDSEVNQSKYLIDSDLKDGWVSFDPAITAGIGRTPLVRADLFVKDACGEDVYVNTRYIKIRTLEKFIPLDSLVIDTDYIYNFITGFSKRQNARLSGANPIAVGFFDEYLMHTYPELNDKTELYYDNLAGVITPVPNDPVLTKWQVAHFGHIDFDTVFNLLQLSKKQFVDIYGENMSGRVEVYNEETGEWMTYLPAGVVEEELAGEFATKQIRNYWDQIRFLGSSEDLILTPDPVFYGERVKIDIDGDAINQNNNLVVGIEEAVENGRYRIVIEAKAKVAAEYHLVEIIEEFEITNPNFDAVRNTVKWDSDVVNAQFNVLAPVLTTEAYMRPEACDFLVDLDTYFAEDATYDPAGVIARVNALDPVTGEVLEAITANYAEFDSTYKRYWIDPELLKVVDKKSGVAYENIAVRTVIDPMGDEFQILSSDGTDFASLETYTGMLYIFENATQDFGVEVVREWLSIGNFIIEGVKLVVDYSNEDDKLADLFNVEVKRPLALPESALGEFTDAVKGGSPLDVDKFLVLTDWANDKVVVDGSKTIGLEEFYNVEDISLINFAGINYADITPEFVDANGNNIQDPEEALIYFIPTENHKFIKTNLMYNEAGTLLSPVGDEPTEVTLPINWRIEIRHTPAAGTEGEKYTLYYHTDGGTVTEIYKIWIPVSIGYKWGNVGTDKGIAITVNPKDQNPDLQSK